MALTADTSLDDGFGHWLAGFIDGEGHFGIEMDKRSGNVKCVFVIGLRSDDDSVLRQVQVRTGIGRIQIDTSALRRTGFQRPQCRWRVERKSECLRLAEILDRFPLRAKKARDYAIWREAVHEWLTIDGRRSGNSRKDWTRMLALKTALHDARRYESSPSGTVLVPNDPQLGLGIG